MTMLDDRTREQRQTHPVIVGGTDRFMSGWGGAEGGVSYAGWACQDGQRAQVESWVRRRGDIMRVRVMWRTWRPRGTGHCHIYVVTDQHPALA